MGISQSKYASEFGVNVNFKTYFVTYEIHWESFVQHQKAGPYTMENAEEHCYDIATYDHIHNARVVFDFDLAVKEMTNE